MVCKLICKPQVRSPRLAVRLSDLERGQQPADNQPRQGVGHLAVTSRSVWTYCFMVNHHIRVADAMTQRLPVDLRIASCGGVAVPDVVQVDLGQTCGRGELLEPPCDRVWMRRPAVLPAEQHAMILIVRPELAPLLIKAAPLRGAGSGAPRAGLWPWEAPPGAPAPSQPCRSR